MSEPEVRQIASLEKSLLDTIKKFHNDFIVSAKVLESMPETLQRGFSDLSTRLQDQIDFLGSLEIAKAQSKYASKKALIDEEIIFLEKKKEQIQEDIKRLLLKYVENQNRLDKQSIERIRQLDSHIFEIMDSDYKKRMRYPRIENDLAFEEVMQAMNHDVAKKRKRIIAKYSEFFQSTARDFVASRKAMKENLEKIKSNIKWDENFELYIPFFVVRMKDAQGNEKIEIFSPARLTSQTNPNSSLAHSLEKTEFLSKQKNLLFEKILSGIKNFKFKLAKIHGSESIGKGLKELKKSGFFAAESEKLFSAMEEDYSIGSF